MEPLKVLFSVRAVSLASLFFLFWSGTTALSDSAGNMEKVDLKFSTKVTEAVMKEQLPQGSSLQYLSEDGKRAIVCVDPKVKPGMMAALKDEICQQCTTPTTPDTPAANLHSDNVDGLQDVVKKVEEHGPAGGTDSVPTYSEKVAPILNKYCISCHNPGGIGGFSLTTYKDAALFAKPIWNAIRDYDMPHGAAWLPSDDCGGGDRYNNPRFLTEAEMKTVHDWATSAQKPPVGDPGQLTCPPMVKETTGWADGDPDIILQNAKNGFTVPPLQPGQTPGSDVFRNFILPAKFDGDTLMKSIEFHPTLTEARGTGTGTGANSFPAVHHVHLFIVPPNTPPDMDPQKLEDDFQKSIPDKKASGEPVVEGPGWDGRNNNFILVGSWFPGSGPLDFGDRALRIPKGSRLVMQVHYTQYAKVPQVDETQVGIRLAHDTVNTEIQNIEVEKIDSRPDGIESIPKGNTHFPITLDLDVDQKMKELGLSDKLNTNEVQLAGVLPHQHQLGQTYSAKMNSDGKDSCLLKLKWDFSHQQSYFLKQPIPIKAGTHFQNTCVYSNPDDSTNPLQPPRNVTFGPDADKEMCRADYFVEFPKDKTPSPTESHVEIYQTGGKVTGFGVTGAKISPGSHIEVNGRFLPDAKISEDGTHITWSGDVAAILKNTQGPYKVAVVSSLGDRSETLSITPKSDDDQ